MNPFQSLFNAVSMLTGGLINDITSMVTGVIVLGFIAMGLDHLKYVLDGVMDRRASDKYFSRAEQVRKARDTWEAGSAGYAQQNALYHRLIRKSADAAERGWR